MSDCPFCLIVSGERSALIVHETEKTVAFLDARPLFPGHVLVVPRLHAETLADLPADLVEPLFLEVRLMASVVEAGTGAQGSFVALNNKVSQSVPHVHVHVVPRTKGDGLKGFFWPRHPYRDAEHAEKTARALRETVERMTSAGR